MLGKDNVDMATNEQGTDDGWNVVHGKKARASVKKRDDMTTSNKNVIMSNKLIK